MRRYLVSLGMAMLVIEFDCIAWAGDFHAGPSLTCSDCHILHESQQHDYNGKATSTTYTPSEHLLKDSDTNKLCKSCHGTGKNSAPDVFENNRNTYNRSAGALNETSSSGNYAHWKGHTLGSIATAPGGTFSESDGLKCTNCHNPHGNKAFRNLRNDGSFTVTITYATDTNDTTKDVFQGAVSPLSTHYEKDNVNLNEPKSSASAFASWCTTCHTDFNNVLGAPMTGASGSSAKGFVRHPSDKVNIGADGGNGSKHSSLDQFKNKKYRIRVMSPAGQWGTQGTAWTAAPTNSLTPTCLTCHKAHGNKNPFGLIYALGNSTLGEEGDGSGVQDLCHQCHKSI